MSIDIANDDVPARFRRLVAEQGTRPALSQGKAGLSYAELGGMLARLAPVLRDATRVGIFADRALPVYAALFAIIASGRTYVPVNPKHPVERNIRVFKSAGIDTLIVRARDLDRLGDALDEVASLVTIVVVDDAPADARHTKQGKTVMALSQMPAATDGLDFGAAGALAYIIFTSGSTGDPKGIGISWPNVAAYIRNVTSYYQPGPDDRFSQLSDLSFDFSVHDVFVAWSAGACLCLPADTDMFAPDKYVERERITCWASVPSIATLLDKFGKLGAGRFASLRWAVFCGERLPMSLARTFAAAAPGAAVYNIYGPSEATVAITAYRIGAEPEIESGLMDAPIGEPFPGHEVALADDGGALCRDGAGEILLGGAQVAAGYWHAPELSARQFVARSFDGLRSRHWYRTGDLGERLDKVGFVFRGRADHQIKIRGFRVELGEIEGVIRAAAGTDFVAVLPDEDPKDATQTRLVAFVNGTGADATALLDACKQKLPYYMEPAEFVFLETMPLNTNGKIDRRQLSQLLQRSDNG
jgi:D-alanine--poly(phosphoribitol) ligase subunit 1